MTTSINPAGGLPPAEQAVIEQALQILEEQARYAEDFAVTSPENTAAYLRLRLGQQPSEVFAALFLDNRHRLIAYEELFHGTIDGASVHPREVVRRALEHNAAAVIFSHNHPSGVTEPSQADIKITKRLREALALIDVRVLDHIVVSASEWTSLTLRGLV